MKTAIIISLLVGIISVSYFFYSDIVQDEANYDVYQYVQDCKTELGIRQNLPILSCLDGQQVPIYVDQEEVTADNWVRLLSNAKKCDNPHWLGGDMGCWTYSHIQVKHLENDNVLVLNCRQKGRQVQKDWFRESHLNLGMNQLQRKIQYEQASPSEKKEMYYLYNTFNDIGLILRNTRSGKSCYLTQYGEAVVGFLPPIDAPLPPKSSFLQSFKQDQAKPPAEFPQALWYRDANQAFRSPAFTAASGCVACHNAHGFKYSPYINSKQGLPDIKTMAKLPFLLVGKPFQDFFKQQEILQVTTDPIEGESQICTRCHQMTTAGTCGYLMASATNHPSAELGAWLTLSARNSWMPPLKIDKGLVKKHLAALMCCCENPHAVGCQSRSFGPTVSDLPKGFTLGQGWVSGEELGLCKDLLSSPQWNANE